GTHGRYGSSPAPGWTRNDWRLWDQTLGCEPHSLQRPLSARSTSQRFQDADKIGDRGAAHVHDPGELCVADLHVAGLPGHLHRGEDVHRDAGRADRVALRLETARRVDRELAALLGPAFEDRARPFAARSETHRLVF